MTLKFLTMLTLVLCVGNQANSAGPLDHVVREISGYLGHSSSPVINEHLEFDNGPCLVQSHLYTTSQSTHLIISLSRFSANLQKTTMSVSFIVESSNGDPQSVVPRVSIKGRALEASALWKVQQMTPDGLRPGYLVPTRIKLLSNRLGGIQYIEIETAGKLARCSALNPGRLR